MCLLSYLSPLFSTFLRQAREFRNIDSFEYPIKPVSTTAYDGEMHVLKQVVRSLGVAVEVHV